MIEAVTSAMLVSGLVFPGIAAYTAVYVTLACMVLFVPSIRGAVFQSRIVWGLLVGFGAMLLSVLLNGATVGNAYVLLILLPFLGVLSSGRFLIEVPTTRFATLCLIGVMAALVTGMVDVFSFGLDRAGGGNNPIHFAAISTMLGMVSLLGAINNERLSRFWFILGPTASGMVVLLSDSRGPMLTLCVLMVIALILFRKDKPFFLALLALPVAAAVGLLLSGEGHRALLLFSGIMNGQTDGSDSLRLVFYEAAIAIFQQSPLWGVGLENFMEIIKQLPTAPPDLHSDLANLASIGGGLGIVTYMAIMAAPLLPLWSRDRRAQGDIVLLALFLSIGNATLGLTNAIIGILPQTILFVVMLAYLSGLELRPRLQEAEMLDQPEP